MRTFIKIPKKIFKIFKYDPDSGLLVRIAKPSRKTRMDEKVGTLNKRGYLQVSINQKTYLYHRICLTLYYGKQLKKEIDHLDGNRSNNKFNNLKLCTSSENNRNRLCNRINEKTYPLVSKVRYGFNANAKGSNGRFYVGFYKCEHEAAMVVHMVENEGYVTESMKRRGIKAISKKETIYGKDSI